MGEGEGGKIWENGIETCLISYMKWITSPGLMQIFFSKQIIQCSHSIQNIQLQGKWAHAKLFTNKYIAVVSIKNKKYNASSWSSWRNTFYLQHKMYFQFIQKDFIWHLLCVSWAFSNPKRWCYESATLNMPANLENSTVATGLEKVSFHSNPKERQCQKNAQTTAQLHSSHTLAK